MIPPKAIPKIEKRLAKLAEWRYEKIADVPLTMAETMEHFREPPKDLVYTDAPVGTRWGSEWSTVWFRGEITLPEAHTGERFYYRHASFSDKLLFIDDIPYAGMNPTHPEVLLPSAPEDSRALQLHIEAYTGHQIPGMDPLHPDMYYHQFCENDPGKSAPLLLEASEVVRERIQTAGFYYDAFVLCETALSLDENSYRRAELILALNTALDMVPMHWETTEILEAACRKARRHIAPLYKDKNAASMPTVGLAGHTHIDIAWLWPLRETIRKGARSFATFLHLMDTYPGLRFQQSQPVLLDMIETHYPALLPRIRARVEDGRWEPNGGMWVEADCNLAGGEALIRQFLEGRKKTMALFGYASDTLWLPDVFGYAAALPQILKQCGISNFVTSKINWNDTNRFPYDTFLWRGIDGTEIFTHFIATRTGGYNAEVRPKIMRETWDQIQQKEVYPGALASVGYGDGGGGVTREMCECADRMEDVDGCVRTRFVSVSEFLRAMRDGATDLPRWVGELYLEYHRGTYTTQSRIKRWNRKMELLLREVEFLCSVAHRDGLFPYPGRELEQIWRVVLTLQFHDILPGSSIHSVYMEAEKTYQGVENDLMALRDAAMGTLADAMQTNRIKGTPFLVVNSLSWERSEFVRIDGEQFGAAYDAEGNELPVQHVNDEGKKSVLVRVTAPPLSVTPIYARNGVDAGISPFRYLNEKSMETPFYKIVVDKSGKITSLVDRANDRELVQRGRRLNDFYVAQDFPVFWDAWDIDRYYRDTVESQDELLSRDIVVEGAHMITFRSKYRIGIESLLVQDVTFYADSPRIDFDTEVDWKENHLLLKVGFPLDIHTDQLRSEIQFGHAVRNTHANTSWDQAQFEVCAHKWVDLSEGDYGVALLNDCKYGHDTLDDMLSLTLLKSPLCPDETADKGKHRFSYALLPHRGPFTAEVVVREAYALNAPLSTFKAGRRDGAETAVTLLEVSNPNVIVEAVKRSEDGNSIIVRAYEAGNTRGQATFTFSHPVSEVMECSALEEPLEALRLKANAFTVAFRPFEIKSFSIRFETGSG